ERTFRASPASSARTWVVPSTSNASPKSPPRATRASCSSRSATGRSPPRPGRLRKPTRRPLRADPLLYKGITFINVQHFTSFIRRTNTMSQTVPQSQPTRLPTADELGFDPNTLREKYAAERTKRLRADGNNQYQEITGQFAHYNVDPYVEPGFTRPALQEEIEVLIIGGGFGGQLAAVRLQEVGITNFRIIEKAGDFGGTWYWNRYPGAQ